MALDTFVEAYAISEDPNLLFNMARCHEQLGEADAAREKYLAFLRSPDADAQGVERAMQFLLGLDRNPLPAPDEPTRVAPLATESVQSAPPERVRPWFALAAGAALAGTGTVLYVLGNNDHEQLTNARGYVEPNAVVPIRPRRAQELIDLGNARKLWGGATLGVGGALIAASLFGLAANGAPRGQQEGRASSWRISLVPLAGKVSVKVSGTF